MEKRLSGVIASRPGFAATVLVGGAIAGVLDGLDAVIFFGLTLNVSFSRIFQGIASGLLGRDAFNGGWQAVALGIVLHFVIALGAATVYFFLARSVPKLLQHPVLAGMAFGLGVFFVMFQIIVPLSRVRPRTTPMGMMEFINELVAHTLFVGIPIAILASRSAIRRQAVCSGATTQPLRHTA